MKEQEVMTKDELKSSLVELAGKHLQVGGFKQWDIEVHKAQAFKLMFEFSIDNNFRVEGYNLKKFVQDPILHWKEICDMLYDVDETPGLADKGFRDLIGFWFNDLCPQTETTE